MKAIKWTYKVTYLDQFWREQFLFSDSDTPESINDMLADLVERGMVGLEGDVPMAKIEQLTTL